MKMITGGIENLQNKKHFFFDLDDTLTRSRSEATPEMTGLLHGLRNSSRTVTVVSGARIEQIRKQIPDMWMGDGGDYSALAQNGNMAYDGRGAIVWERMLSQEQRAEILTYIETVLQRADLRYPDKDDLVQDRGAQISFSLYGHNAPLEEKEAYDPTMSRRKAILEKFPFVSATVEVKIGGTTTFDFFAKGFNKGKNITDFIALPQFGWPKDDCVYFGDRLEPGGNDETVVGIIDTFPVKNAEDCAGVLRGILHP